MKQTKETKVKRVASTSNDSHITISLDKDTREYYQNAARACDMPLRTFLRLVLVAGMTNTRMALKSASEAIREVKHNG